VHGDPDQDVIVRSLGVLDIDIEYRVVENARVENLELRLICPGGLLQSA
jgi:hypothetical protein